MVWNKTIIDKVRKLRVNGHTYYEICQKIKRRIPKSTLSYWCQDIKLPADFRRRIAKINVENREKGRLAALEANRIKREKFLNKLKKKNLHLIAGLNKREKKLLLAIFYLCEGSKYPSTQCLKFASTDPEIIKFFLFLLRESFAIDESKFRVETICRADQELSLIVGYWQKVARISKDLFYRPRIDKRTIGKKTRNKNYKGVCVIIYFDTSIQLELQLLSRSLIGGYSSVG